LLGRYTRKNIVKPIHLFILMLTLLFIGCSCRRHAYHPIHFIVDRYPYEEANPAVPGKHYWNGAGQIWIDQYESGSYRRFQVIGDATVGNNSGVLLVQISPAPGENKNPGYQIFIPEIGGQLLTRNKNKDVWGKWTSLGEMQRVQCLEPDFNYY
jgi:hypothetical protein